MAKQKRELKREYFQLYNDIYIQKIRWEIKKLEATNHSCDRVKAGIEFNRATHPSSNCHGTLYAYILPQITHEIGSCN